MFVVQLKTLILRPNLMGGVTSVNVLTLELTSASHLMYFVLNTAQFCNPRLALLIQGGKPLLDLRDSPLVIWSLEVHKTWPGPPNFSIMSMAKDFVCIGIGVWGLGGRGITGSG